MANRQVKILPTTDVSGYFTAAMASTIKDADCKKPVKLTGCDTYSLCAEGDLMDGFLMAVENATEGGLAVVSIDKPRFMLVEADGAMNIGDIVVAGEQPAAGVQNANTIPKVKALDLASSTFDDYLGKTLWRVVSSNTPTVTTVADGDKKVVIERV